MKKQLLKLATSLLGLAAVAEFNVACARNWATNDVSFLYRMGAGSPGDVTRYENSKIQAHAIDGANPVLAFGLAAVYDRTNTNGVRSVVAADTVIDGFAVRPYPTQQSSGSNFGAASFGVGAPPAAGVIDVIKSGYFLAKLGGATAAQLGGTVYVWVAASSGTHVQGGVEAATSAGNTITLDAKSYFNGPADAGGIVEVCFNI